MATLETSDQLLGEDDPDPVGIIRLAGVSPRYLDAVVPASSHRRQARGATTQELVYAYGHPNSRFPWQPGPASS